MLRDVDGIEWRDPEVADRLRGLSGDDDPADMPATVLCDSALGDDAVAAAMMVSPESETRDDSARVRATVAARAAEVAALADDGNWLVRTHTYLVLGRCGGPADVLLRRWDGRP